MPQFPNTIRFVCKLINTGQQHIYDCNNTHTVSEFLNSIDHLIKKDFNLNNGYKLIVNLNENNEIILDHSNDSLNTKFINKDYIKIHVKPNYRYSIPECILFNSGENRDRLAYIIKLDAIKKIQRFYRFHNRATCPLCYENNNMSNMYYDCNHIICRRCFEEWRNRNGTCPFCRSNVRYNYRSNINNTNIENIINIENIQNTINYIPPIEENLVQPIFINEIGTLSNNIINNNIINNNINFNSDFIRIPSSASSTYIANSDFSEDDPDEIYYSRFGQTNYNESLYGEMVD